MIRRLSGSRRKRGASTEKKRAGLFLEMRARFGVMTTFEFSPHVWWHERLRLIEDSWKIQMKLSVDLLLFLDGKEGPDVLAPLFDLRSQVLFDDAILMTRICFSHHQYHFFLSKQHVAIGSAERTSSRTSFPPIGETHVFGFEGL